MTVRHLSIVNNITVVINCHYYRVVVHSNHFQKLLQKKKDAWEMCEAEIEGKVHEVFSITLNSGKQ